MYPRNAASPERIFIGAVVQISDGAVQSSGVSVTVTPQGGSETAGGGTVAYSARGGVWYTPTQAETNYASFMVEAGKTGCIPVGATVVTTASATPGYAGVDWSKVTAPTTTLNLSGTTIKTATDVETDTADIQSRLPAALVSGRIDASVGAMAANTMTAAAAASDLTTELQTGLATAANLAIVAGYLDTEIAAIKAVTDALPNAGALTTIQADLDDIQTRLPAALVSGRIDASVGAMASGVLTATAIAADAITDAKVASDVTIASVTGAVGSVTGAVGSVTGNVGGNVTGSVGSVASGGITRASLAADTGLQSVRSNTAQAGASTSITLDASASATTDFYINHLVLLTGGTGVGQARYITAYNGTTKVATVAAWATNPDNTSTFALLAGDAIPGATAPSAATIADAVWDEILSGHAVSGSTGEALAAAGSAGDPWITALPGSYSAGQAGKIVGDYLNASVSSRATQTSVDTIDGIVDAILVDTAEIGAAGAGLTALASASNLATVAGYLDTEIAAIKAKTDNLPADPADASDIASSFSTVNSTLSTIAGYIDTEVAAIKAKTDNLPAAPAAVGDIPSAATVAAAVGAVVVEGSTTVVQSLRLSNAALGGKASGLDTTNPKYRDLADTKDRIDATVDVDGNRSAVTRDLT